MPFLLQAPKIQIILIAMQGPSVSEMETLKSLIDNNDLDIEDLKRMPNLKIMVLPAIVNDKNYFFVIESAVGKLSYNDKRNWEEVLRNAGDTDLDVFKIFYPDYFSIKRISSDLIGFL